MSGLARYNVWHRTRSTVIAQIAGRPGKGVGRVHRDGNGKTEVELGVRVRVGTGVRARARARAGGGRQVGWRV